MAQASNGYFAISKETTAGTAITTPTKFYPVEEVDISFDNEFIDAYEMRGSRQAYTALDGRIAPEVTAKGLVYPGGAMASLFKGALGAASSATVSGATGNPVAKKHTFSNAAVLPTYTIERADARSGEGGIICERVAGCKLESLSLTCAFGELVEWDATWQATKKPVTASAVAANTITYPSMDPMVFKGASVYVDGVANNYFKSMNIEINNTLERQEALNGSQEAYKIFEGGVECTISGTMVFEALTFYNKLLDSTSMELQLKMDGGVCDDSTTPDTLYNITMTWDKVKVMRHSIPFVANEVIEADVEFKVLYNPTNNRSVLVEMTNVDTAVE